MYQNLLQTTAHDIPQEFFCPILQRVMHDPVYTVVGNTYERRAIEKWFRHHDTDPITGATLPSKKLSLNIPLRTAINSYDPFISSLTASAKAIRPVMPDDEEAILNVVEKSIQPTNRAVRYERSAGSVGVLIKPPPAKEHAEVAGLLEMVRSRMKLTTEAAASSPTATPEAAAATTEGRGAVQKGSVTGGGENKGLGSDLATVRYALRTLLMAVTSTVSDRDLLREEGGIPVLIALLSLRKGHGHGHRQGQEDAVGAMVGVEGSEGAGARRTPGGPPQPPPVGRFAVEAHSNDELTPRDHVPVQDENDEGQRKVDQEHAIVAPSNAAPAAPAPSYVCNDIEVKVNAARILGIITYSNAANQVAIRTFGGLPVLFNWLCRDHTIPPDDVEIYRYVVQTVCNISTLKDNQEALRLHGGIPPLILITAKSNVITRDVETKRHAAKALANCCSGGNVSNMYTVLRSNGLPRLVALITFKRGAASASGFGDGYRGDLETIRWATMALCVLSTCTTNFKTGSEMSSPPNVALHDEDGDGDDTSVVTSTSAVSSRSPSKHRWRYGAVNDITQNKEANSIANPAHAIASFLENKANAHCAALDMRDFIRQVGGVVGLVELFAPPATAKAAAAQPASSPVSPPTQPPVSGSSDILTLRFAAKALANLAANAVNRDAIRECGGIPLLINKLPAPPASPVPPATAGVTVPIKRKAQQGAGAGAGAGVEGDSGAKKGGGGEEEVPFGHERIHVPTGTGTLNTAAIAHAAAQKDTETMANIATALGNLALNDTNLDAIREAGGMKAIVCLLTGYMYIKPTEDMHAVEAVRYAVRCIVNLTRQSTHLANKYAFRNAHVIPPLVTILGVSKDKETLNYATIAMEQLNCDSVSTYTEFALKIV